MRRSSPWGHPDAQRQDILGDPVSAGIRMGGGRADASSRTHNAVDGVVVCGEDDTHVVDDV